MNGQSGWEVSRVRLKAIAVIVGLGLCLLATAGCDRTQTTIVDAEEQGTPASTTEDSPDSTTSQTQATAVPDNKPVEALAHFLEGLDNDDNELVWSVVPSEYQGMEPIEWSLPTAGTAEHPIDYQYSWRGDELLQSWTIEYSVSGQGGDEHFVYMDVSADDAHHIEWGFDWSTQGSGEVVLDSNRWVVVAVDGKPVGEYFK